MKKNTALFSLIAIFTLLLSGGPSFAHSHSNAGAVIAGTVAGIAAGVVIGNAVSSSNHYYYPQRRYKPRHHHKIGCSCCVRPVYVNAYPSYSYPAYINYRWR